jgi:hypothetical protein
MISYRLPANSRSCKSSCWLRFAGPRFAFHTDSGTPRPLNLGKLRVSRDPSARIYFQIKCLYGKKRPSHWDRACRRRSSVTPPLSSQERAVTVSLPTPHAQQFSPCQTDLCHDCRTASSTIADGPALRRRSVKHRMIKPPIRSYCGRKDIAGFAADCRRPLG